MTPRAVARSRSLLFCLCACALLCPSARADRLHLAGGGTILVDSWWIEGPTVHYRNAGGTVGLPRSMVVRFESTESSSPRPEETPATAPSPPRLVERSSPAAQAGVPRLTEDQARRLGAAAAALNDRDYESAASLYESVLLDADGDLQTPRVGYAVSRIALGEDDLALAVVLDGLARSPSHSDLLQLHGELMNRQERVEEALISWREAFAQSPTDTLRDKIVKAERELQAARDHVVSGSPHFNVRYDGDVDVDLAEAVMAYLEDEYWSLADSYDHAPQQPVTVVLYSRRDFKSVTQAADWVGGLYDGKIRVPLAGLTRVNRPAATVLTHELVHAFVQSKTRGHCPRWLHEGLAQQTAGQEISPKDREHILERLAGGDPAKWEAQGFSYPMSLALTRYLQSLGGFDDLVELLHRLGDGETLNAAMLEVFGQDYAQLCRAWARDTLDGFAP